MCAKGMMERRLGCGRGVGRRSGPRVCREYRGVDQSGVFQGLSSRKPSFSTEAYVTTLAEYTTTTTRDSECRCMRE